MTGRQLKEFFSDCSWITESYVMPSMYIIKHDGKVIQIGWKGDDQYSIVVHDQGVNTILESDCVVSSAELKHAALGLYQMF